MLMLIKFWKIFYLQQGVEVTYQRKQMITFNDFVKKYNLKNKATSNLKIQKVLTSIGLDNVNIYPRDGPF